MPVKQSTSGSAGVAVPLKKVDRRRALLIAAAVALVVVVLAVVLPMVLRDDNGKPTGAGRQTGAAAATASGQPQAPAPTTPAATAAPSATAAPTATTAPTTAPTTAAPAGDVALPAGWYMYRDGSGFSVPAPKGWSVSTRGTERYFQENGQSGRLLIVDQTDQPKPDPVADWTAQERARRGGYRDYHLIGIRKVDYWDSAADWEFTRTSDRGNPLHVLKRGFITAKDKAYGISWSTSADDWAANKANLELIFRGFKPARS
jgi:hypothetical protein